MTAEEILGVLEDKVAPVKLSDEFCKKMDAYDNSGLLINCGGDVTGALFSLDLSEEAVKKAISKGYNLIVTHHPVIYGGISRFDIPKEPHARAIATCIKSGISVISMHLNFDAAPNGIDHNLMVGLGGKSCKVMVELEGGGYGRVYKVTPTALSTYLEQLAKTFGTNRIVCHGQDKRTVKKVASFCGAGCDFAAVKFAIREKANVLVSSDIPHHIILELVENGIAVIELTHYSAESYGFKKIYDGVKNSLGIQSAFFADARFI